MIGRVWPLLGLGASGGYAAPEERKALVTEFFEEITVSERGIEDFVRTELWKRYMRTVVPCEVEGTY